MTENDQTQAADLREETAEAAPELATNDRVGELENQLAEAKQNVLYAQAEVQNVRRRAEKESHIPGDGVSGRGWSMNGRKGRSANPIPS